MSYNCDYFFVTAYGDESVGEFNAYHTIEGGFSFNELEDLEIFRALIVESFESLYGEGCVEVLTDIEKHNLIKQEASKMFGDGVGY